MCWCLTLTDNFHELFPVSRFMQRLIENNFFSQGAMNISSDFYKVQISKNQRNNQQIILKLFVLTVDLATTGMMLPVVREITHIQNI